MFKKAPPIALLSLLAAALVLAMATDVDARQRAAGQARASVNRPSAGHAQRANVNRAQARPQARTQARPNVNTSNRGGNRTNIDNSTRNVNINNNRDVDIDVDGGGRWGYDDHYHPIATAAAVTATVAVTAAVVGSIVSPAQMPSSCVQVIRYDIAYMQCGSTWYQPQYQGSNVTYVVVNAP